MEYKATITSFKRVGSTSALAPDQTVVRGTGNDIASAVAQAASSIAVSSLTQGEAINIIITAKNTHAPEEAL